MTDKNKIYSNLQIAERLSCMYYDNPLKLLII